MTKILIPLAALMLPLQTQPGAEPGKALTAVVEAEKAFARLSQTTGMRTAFLTHLANGAIVFQPGPVDGRAAYAAAPDVPGMLQWKPVYAEVSLAGDLGFTTGPWVLERAGQEEALYGHYVTVWKRQPDGTWKVVIDAGVPHGKPAESPDSVHFPPSGESPPPGAAAPLESLLEADRNLSAVSVAEGFPTALRAQAAPTLRLYRPARLPLTDPAAVAAALASDSEAVWSWRPDGGDAAQSGDLGYSYGIARSVGGAQNSYLRIWKRGPEGDWKVALDLANPLER